MLFTDLSFRRGTSTVLGTIIFIGIMFTAVIPMFIVMRQADTIHELRKHELGLLDEERRIEDISFYAYVLYEGSDEIWVNIENRGKDIVKIVRVWINDAEHPQDENIQPGESRILGPFIVALQFPTFYTAKVITEKGVVFSSEAGTLLCAEDGWYTLSLGIGVHITNIRGKYLVVAKKEIEGVEFFHYESSRMEHDEVEVTIYVDGPGSYYLTIKKDDGGSWIDVNPPYNDFEVVVVWPASKPITDVYVDGILSP